MWLIPKNCNFRAFIFYFFLVIAPVTIFATSPCFSQESRFNERPTISQATDQAFERIGVLFQNSLEKIARNLKAQNYVNVTFGNICYDKNLRRIFVDFRGSATFTGQLPFKFEITDYYLVSEEDIAYDFTIEKINNKSSGITFEFRGDLVVFFDKLLFKYIKQACDKVGTIAFKEATDRFCEFFEKLDADLLSKAISATFQQFSKVAFTKVTSEVINNAVKKNNPKLADLVKDTFKDDKILNFVCITLIRLSVNNIATITGTTVGTTLGNLVAPGPGGVVGAFLGTKLYLTVAKTVIYNLTVGFPMKAAIKGVIKSFRNLQTTPGNELAQSKFDKFNDFILKRVKKEFEDNSYGTLNLLFASLAMVDKKDIPAFFQMIEKIKDLLSVKILRERDWYAAKKYNELKLHLEKWGILDKFSF